MKEAFFNFATFSRCFALPGNSIINCYSNKRKHIFTRWNNVCDTWHGTNVYAKHETEKYDLPQEQKPPIRREISVISETYLCDTLSFFRLCLAELITANGLPSYPTGSHNITEQNVLYRIMLFPVCLWHNEMTSNA